VVLSNSANLPLMNSAHFGTFYLPSSLLRVTPILTQQRQFASPRGRRPTPNKKQSNVLANEKLIAVIMSKHTNTPPNEVMVRLVIDEGPENPATVSVVSLSEAIEVSVARNKDLIGTSLQSDPPVIRATDISKMEYRQQQSQQKGIAKSKTQKKTIRFRAGISDHDLERKMEGLMKFLDQGLECDYSVFSKKKLLRVNAEAGMDLVERIQVLLADHATLKRPPQPNELKNYVRVNLVPKKNAKV
jgi:translation initiation factor IF-3